MTAYDRRDAEIARIAKETRLTYMEIAQRAAKGGAPSVAKGSTCPSDARDQPRAGLNPPTHAPYSNATLAK
jgi:hypothetical protein